MRNLVADLIEFQGPLPLVAAPVQNQCQTVPETQPGVFRIVQAPRPAVPPFPLRVPQPNGVPAGVAYPRFQLSPGQNEIRLLVESLLARVQGKFAIR